MAGKYCNGAAIQRGASGVGSGVTGKKRPRKRSRGK